MKQVFMVVLLFAGFLGKAQTYTLTIGLEHTIKDKGQVLIYLYNNEDTYLKEPAISMTFPVAGDGVYEIKNIPKGHYAVSIVHDVNNNGKLDYDTNGIPVEEYGFSNDAPSNHGPARYNDALINIAADTKISVAVQ